MSLDADGFRWCDRCWNEQAVVVLWLDDGSRKDLCAECDAQVDEPDAYRVEVQPMRENWA